MPLGVLTSEGFASSDQLSDGGPAAKPLMQRPQLRIGQDFGFWITLVLEYKQRSGDLQAVCLFLITDLIWREVQCDRTTPKFVVFDECWALLENEAGARFLGEVFRTFRKYRASAIAISQTMVDFAK